MSDKPEPRRLVTRSDFDGLVCAILLRARKLIGDVKFVHPKDMQDGLIATLEDDITANLPYVQGVHLAFDHHASEQTRVQAAPNHILHSDAPSTARIIYDYYGGAASFPSVSPELLDAVDKGDSATFTEEEVLAPDGWNLLNFIMDPRTGLGRFKSFRVSNYQLMMELIDYCVDHTIDQTLDLPDVRERVELYRSHESAFQEQLRSIAQVRSQILVIDLRTEDTIFAGNRFVQYALYPDAQVSVQVMWGFKKQNTVIVGGKSIFNRDSRVNLGELMLKFGGGGHAGAATCQVANDRADTVLAKILEAVQRG